jgi:hypothetical protein
MPSAPQTIMSVAKLLTRFLTRASAGNIIERFSGVDEIEDAKSREFQKAQEFSKNCPPLIETECIENRAFSQQAGIRLGRRCAPPFAHL